MTDRFCVNVCLIEGGEATRGADRIDEVSDPMLDYFGAIRSAIGGGIRTIRVLGETPFKVELEREPSNRPG